MNTCTQVKQHAVKLALLSAFAIGAASTMGSAAAVNIAEAVTAASIVLPIGITSARPLSFGRIVSTGTAGTVLISTAGLRSTGGSETLLVEGATATSARFDITGQPGSSYSIGYANTVLTSGIIDNDMSLTPVSDLTGSTSASGKILLGELGGDGKQSLYIGGTLSVAANQPAGDYIGTITATVNYN